MIPILKLIWNSGNKDGIHYRKCKACGNKNPINATICHICGAPLAYSTAKPATDVYKAYLLRPFSARAFNLKLAISTGEFIASALFMLFWFLVFSAFFFLSTGSKQSGGLPILIIDVFGVFLFVVFALLVMQWIKGFSSKTRDPMRVVYNPVHDTIVFFIVIIVSLFSFIYISSLFS